MTRPCRFARLFDGTWGVRLHNKRIAKGDTVYVSRRDGGTVVLILGCQIFRSEDVQIFRIDRVLRQHRAPSYVGLW